MGKTPTPLIIWVDPAWRDHPSIADLRDKGHEVSLVGGYPDLILSSAAWYWTDESWPHLEVALKQARARRKGASK